MGTRQRRTWESGDPGIRTARTWGTTVHQGHVAPGTQAPQDTSTPAGRRWGRTEQLGAVVARGLAPLLEVLQVLEDEDEGGPAEDEAAEGAALQQPREQRPQALGQPRATTRHRASTAALPRLQAHTWVTGTCTVTASICTVTPSTHTGHQHPHRVTGTRTVTAGTTL